MFEKSNNVSREEIALVRLGFERLLRDYNIFYYQRDFVGQYVIKHHQREIHGMYPITLKELALVLTHAAVLIFPRSTFSLIESWLVEFALYAPEFDNYNWETEFRKFYGDFRERLVADGLA